MNTQNRTATQTLSAGQRFATQFAQLVLALRPRHAVNVATEPCTTEQLAFQLRNNVLALMKREWFVHLEVHGKML